MNLSACATIENRSKPPPIEYFKTNYEKIYKDLLKTNSFSFIYKNDKYYFNLAETYIDQGPQLYYLGYKNENLQYALPAKDISLLKDIFKSKDLLYKKTQKILAKLDELNLYPTKSIAYEIQPKSSILYDLTNDTMNFLVYGSMAVIAIPWIVVGYTDYLSEEKEHKKLDDVRLGMTHKEVDKLISQRFARKSIDQYQVEIFSSSEKRWYMNALLIFEDNILVGMVRSLTNEPITDYYKKL